MHKSTLHIKVKPELAKGLKDLARKREMSVGELIRQAIISCYQVEIAHLNEKQRRAVEAFQGGYISLGKLAEEILWAIGGDTAKFLTKMIQGNNLTEISRLAKDVRYLKRRHLALSAERDGLKKVLDEKQAELEELAKKEEEFIESL